MISYRSASAQALEAQREADFTRIQKDYLERVGWMRTNPDEASYRQEVAPFFKTYFEQVDATAQVQAGTRSSTRYLEELDKRGDKDERARDKKAYRVHAQGVRPDARGPLQAACGRATDKGMRLDVLSSDVVMVLGKPQVRLQLVLWGAQREERDDGKVKKMVTSASFKTQWKLTDEKGKLIGEMTGEDPSMKIDFPERYIAEFPPQMVLGHYDMDLVPSEVKKMEITFNVSSRSASGGEPRPVRVEAGRALRVAARRG